MTKYFCQNNFPYSLVTKTLDAKLDRISSTGLVKLNVPKKDFYTVLPYISPTANKDIKKSLSKLIGDYFPQLNFKLIFKNDYSVESFFRFKDRVPTPMLSNVV